MMANKLEQGQGRASLKIYFNLVGFYGQTSRVNYFVHIRGWKMKIQCSSIGSRGIRNSMESREITEDWKQWI